MFVTAGTPFVSKTETLMFWAVEQVVVDGDDWKVTEATASAVPRDPIPNTKTATKTISTFENKEREKRGGRLLLGTGSTGDGSMG